jgi:hypothetical protein
MLLPFGIISSSGGAAAFELITTTVLDSTSTSVTFNNLATLAAGYKHLQLRMVTRTNRAGSDAGDAYIQYNGDTAGNYSAHQMYGDGSSTSSAPYVNQSFMYLTSPLGPNNISGSFSASIHDILDFSNTSKYKTMRGLSGGAGYGAGHGAPITLWAGSWRSTSAITSMTITCAYSASFVAGSRFSLYGFRG